MRHEDRAGRDAELKLPLLRPHDRRARPLHIAVLRVGLDFALFASVLLAWPVLRLGRVVLGRGRAR